MTEELVYQIDRRVDDTRAMATALGVFMSGVGDGGGPPWIPEHMHDIVRRAMTRLRACLDAPLYSTTVKAAPEQPEPLTEGWQGVAL